MNIMRKEAIILASYLALFSLSPEQRESKIKDALVEEDEPVNEEAELLSLLRQYLYTELEIVTNSYLQEVLAENGLDAVVVGKEPQLYACECCGYKTLERKGEYFICPVCFWEDDGNIDADTYSHANKMTLREARDSFERSRFSGQNAGRIFNTDRLQRFHHK